MEVVSALRSMGVDARPESVTRAGAAADAVLDVTAGDVKARFAVDERARAPYPNELSKLEDRRQRLSELGHPLLLAPFISDALGAALTGAEWSWADAQGNFDLRAPGLLLRQRLTSHPPRIERRSLPTGSGALAIIRAFIRSGEGEGEASATALANQANVSQPRASQVLRQLSDLGLVTKSASRRWVPSRAELLDRFLAEYRGPGGSQRNLYSLDSPIDVAVRASEMRSRLRRIAVSADVGPDLLVPWRRPTVVVLYTTVELPPAELGIVEAQGRHDANVLVRTPADRSVFRDHEPIATVRGVDVPLADETQLIWDLQDLGGADRFEAAGMMREWLLNRR